MEYKIYLYPAERYRINKNRVSIGNMIIKRRKIKYNTNKFINDLKIIERGLTKDIYNSLDHLINGKNHNKVRKLK